MNASKFRINVVLTMDRCRKTRPVNSNYGFVRFLIWNGLRLTVYIIAHVQSFAYVNTVR